MRALRGAAWAVFLLDLVILAQLVYGWVTVRGGPTAEAMLRGLSLMLGAALVGLLILLVASSRMHSRAGLSLALLFGAVPLLWAVDAIFESLWQ